LSRRLWLAAITLTTIITLTSIILLSTSKEPAPQYSPPVNRTVSFGLLIGDKNDTARLEYAARQAAAEVNEYCEAQGNQWSFRVVTLPASDPQQVIVGIQKLEGMGVKIFLCDWNTPICSFQTYIVLHNLTIIGVPESHCRSHKQVDSVYRMSPNLKEETEAFAALLRTKAVKALIVLKESGSTDYLNSILPIQGFGVESVKEIVHDHTEAEPNEWKTRDAERSKVFMDEVSSTLHDMLERYRPEEIGVVYAYSYFNENQLIEIGNHPELLQVIWYTTPLLVINQTQILAHSDVTTRIHLLTPVLAPDLEKNVEYNRLEEGYEVTQAYLADPTPLGVTEASLYDAVKVAALSLIHSEATEGKTLQSTIMQEASNYVGATGRMTLDENGDRIKSNFDIYGYYEVSGLPGWVRVGHYNSETEITELY